MVPYWIVPVSARTSIVATDMLHAGRADVATTAALFGVVFGGFGRSVGGVGRLPSPPDLVALLLTPSAWALGPAGSGCSWGSECMVVAAGPRRPQELDNNYNFPVVALKALTEYQPKELRLQPGRQDALRRVQDSQGDPHPQRRHRRGRRQEPGEDLRRPGPVGEGPRTVSHDTADAHRHGRRRRRAPPRADLVRKVRPQGREDSASRSTPTLGS